MVGFRFISMLFGGGRNVIRDTAGIFIPNAENRDRRNTQFSGQVMSQYANEFGHPGIINRVADGLNRLGRPVITYGVIFLFLSAMYDPIWFAARMQGLVLVPEPLWMIFGAIVSFFFGARELSKFRSSSMAKEAARLTAAAPQVIENITTLRRIHAQSPGVAQTGNDTNMSLRALEPSENEAVDDWRDQK